jgi:hypothetical protein
MLDDSRLRTIGGRRPTGATMSPGRRAGLGGTCAPPHPARIQSVLPIHRQCDGSRRPEPGGFSTNLPHARKLPTSVRSFSNLADQRDAEFACGSLPANAPRPADRFDRRCHAAVGRETFFSASARQAGRGWRIEHSTAAWSGAAFARTERVGNFARLARSGVQRNSGSAASAGGHGKIADQSRAHRARENPYGNGA